MSCCFRLLFEYFTRDDEVFVLNKYCGICNTNMKMIKDSNYNSDNRFQKFKCVNCNIFLSSYSMYPKIKK
jgi:hypothetical protein